jgi:outer membrane protein assembly factor BamB
VLFQGPTGIDAHDVATGKKKWSAPNLRPSAFATLTFSDGVIYASSDKFTAVHPGKGKANAEILWQSLKLRPAYCSPVAQDGLVYVVTNGGIVTCADGKTGEVVWTERLAAGAYAASPLIADGRLYVTNEAGVTSILQTGRTAKLLATNPIGDTILACPVVSDGAIFLRSDGALYCIGAKK